jgi:hypothetical protein
VFFLKCSAPAHSNHQLLSENRFFWKTWMLHICEEDCSSLKNIISAEHRLLEMQHGCK